jgi:hypothetical protein
VEIIGDMAMVGSGVGDNPTVGGRGKSQTVRVGPISLAA